MSESAKKPKEPRITITFSTSQEMKDWIIDAAEHDERSVSVFINRIIKDRKNQTVCTSEQS